MQQGWEYTPSSARVLLHYLRQVAELSLILGPWVFECPAQIIWGLNFTGALVVQF